MENEGVIEEEEPVFENTFLPTGHQIDILADEVFFRRFTISEYGCDDSI